jgi:AbrB family looped-hinge helix DNA binding protein
VGLKFPAVAVVKVDSKGRVVIPKRLREKVGLREGGFARVDVRDGVVVIEPLESVGEAYFGVFKVESWPEDLDSFLVEAVRELWLRKATST